jgi:S-sulfosulfanyl-L-cysteine sulfohydrolase
MNKKRTSMKQNRRNFIKNTMLASLAPVATPLVGRATNAAQNDGDDPIPTPPQTGTLTLLQTTDVHCQIHPHDELFWENDRAVFRQTGGYAHLATLFKQARKRNPNTFIVDTGDMFQGSALSVKTTGKAIAPILDALNYDLCLPGNWEVVYYKKAMQSLLGGLRAPKVCANMHHDAGEGKRGELVFQPYHTWSRLGVKIGFLGYTDPLVPLRQSPNYSKGIVYSKPEETLAYWVDVLRTQEQCDMVILLAHLGLSQQIALANLPECAGVDYIFGGDTHERVRTPIECKYAKVVEPGAFGSFVGRLDVEVQNGKVTGHRYELVEVSPKKYRADKPMLALLKQLEQPHVAQIEQVVGYSTVPLYRYFVVENTIDTLIVDALKWKLAEEVDIVLSNGFRFCPPRSTPDHTGNIPITEGYLFDMLPIDSPVRKAKVTGTELQKWLEKELNNVFAKDASKRFGGWMIKFKGMELAFRAFGEQGKRVEWATVGGQPLLPDRTYTLPPANAMATPRPCSAASRTFRREKTCPIRSIPY